MGGTSSIPRWADIVLLPLLNLILAFLISGLVVLMIGENPLMAYYAIFYGAFGSGDGLGYTLYYATNFVFTGLAVAIAAHAGLFNIGAEGQAYVAGLGAILVALALDQTSVFLVVPLAILGAAAFGGMWAAIPGWLQAKRGSHIVITTIMFNFIASAAMIYVLNRFLKPAGSNGLESRVLDQTAWMPQLRLFMPGFGFSPVNLSIVLALLLLVGFYILVWHTKFGFALRTMGKNPLASRYAGMSNVKLIVITMAISGGLAGMMAINQVLGLNHRLVENFVAGAGFVGIAVALMGRNHPVGIALAALLFGVLYQGGSEMQFVMPNVNKEVVSVVQALVILFTGAMEGLFRPSLERLFAGWGGSGKAEAIARTTAGSES
ncbi:simple sugar transport system permease protein [Devosia enhydra]|uniref:Simple sugar transport system permease protein n=1 Tax=Devosia enhydra TaxID=665118 RepID=A0A1K2HY06_9HYPH|nr:ABC transporter permease [Devosia enhydra]SFZ84332.1 simple sugar transport system permease protein [Devosia enhydra]